MDNFHRTGMGRQFFSQDVPAIAKALPAIADALTRIAGGKLARETNSRSLRVAEALKAVEHLPDGTLVTLAGATSAVVLEGVTLGLLRALVTGDPPA